MNFSAINPKFSLSPEEEIQAFLTVGWEKNYIEKMLIDLKKSFREFLDVIELMAKDIPEKNFLVRPHPFEKEEIYKKRFQKFSNVWIDGRGDVLNVLNASDAVIHLNCGTSVESNMLRKLPISLEFLNTEILLSHTPLPTKISYPAKSYEELKAIINSIEEKEAEHPFDQIHNEFIFPWFGPNDGNAAKRVSECILNFLSAKTTKKEKKSRIIDSLCGSHDSPSPMQLVQGTLVNTIGSLKTFKIRNYKSSRSEKLVTAYNISEGYEKIARTRNAMTNISHCRHPLWKTKLTSIHLK